MSGAFITAGSALVGGYLSYKGSSNAANAQKDAANTAAAQQQRMFDTTNTQQEPWRNSGVLALNQLSNLTGISTGKQDTSESNFDSAKYLSLNPDAKKYMQTSHNSAYQHYVANGSKSNGDFWKNTNTGGPGTPGYNSLNNTVDPAYHSSQFSFNNKDLNDQLAPNYAFMRDQGLGAINNQASVSGGLVGGNALKGINDYAMNYAQNGYQNAFTNAFNVQNQNYNQGFQNHQNEFNNVGANQTNIFNRLSSIAGLGQASLAQSGENARTFGGNIGSAQLAGGAAQAAGYMGEAKGLSNGINGAASWYAAGNNTGIGNYIRNFGANQAYGGNPYSSSENIST